MAGLSWAAPAGGLVPLPLLVALLSLPLAVTGNLRFEPLVPPPRVYAAAPAGLLVAQVRARDLADPTVRPTYFLPQGADYDQFSLDRDTGHITTKRPVERGVNDTYELAVIAYGGGESRVQQISVIVSQRNRYPPVFTQKLYRAEAAYHSPSGTPLVRVQAVDNDTVSYNREIHYSLQATPHAERYLKMEQASGEVRLRRRPRVGLAGFNVTVVARDLGSPAYRATAQLQVTFRSISEPLAVRAVQSSGTSAYVCWRRPRSGTVSGYLLDLRSDDGHNVSRLVLREGGQIIAASAAAAAAAGRRRADPAATAGGEQPLQLHQDEECTLLEGLRPHTQYRLVVHGHRDREKGMASRAVSFGTRLSGQCALRHPCGPGSCDPSPVWPGYTCSCPGGTFGQHCENVDPCFSKPCHNLGVCRNVSSGEFECRCLAGFYGATCDQYNPCLGAPATCQNGGTCRSNISNTYKCECPKLYRGDQCETHDPCLSAPCLNDATCYIEGSTHRCHCAAGFTGPNCEERLSFCSSSPCHSAATCVEATANYTCLCPPGFTGPTCRINRDECADQPCLNGGTCLDGLDAFSCSCPAAFTGTRCEERVSFCSSSPCDGAATCIEGATNYTCLCPPGFAGPSCRINRDECVDEPCYNGGTCRDGVNSFFCVCSAAFTGSLCQKQVPCPAEEQNSVWGVLAWPASLPGAEALLPCPLGGATSAPPPAVAARRCLSGEAVDAPPQWQPAQTQLCRQERAVHAQNVSVDLLRTVTSLDVDPATFTSAARQLTEVMSEAASDQQAARSALRTVSQLMETNSSAIQLGGAGAASAALGLAGAVELLASNLRLARADTGHRLTLRTPNVAVEAVEYTGEELLSMSGRPLDIYTSMSAGTVTVVSGVDSDDDQEQEDEDDDDEDDDEYDDDEDDDEYDDGDDDRPTQLEEDQPQPETKTRVQVPFSVLRRAARRQRRLRLVVVTYRTSRLFPAPMQRASGPDPGVVTVTIPGYNSTQLPEPVLLNLGVHQMEGFQQRCVFWDEDAVAWSTAGVTTSHTGTGTVCATSHLTSFSVLFDPVAAPFSGIHQRVLSVISYAGAGLSLLGLALTILTYSLFRSLNRDRQGKILLNLCASLLLLNAVFLASNLTLLLPSAELCLSSAVLIHYFVLSSLSWMLVEAVNMYQLIITVFATSESNFMLKRLLLAWGTPLAVVLAVLGWDRAAYYRTVDRHFCVLTAGEPFIYYISFFGPCCAIVLVNVVVFLLVARVLFQQRTLGKFGAVRKTISFSQVRGAFTVMTLLGVTWILGAFALGRARLAFSYIFTILNSAQGFIIFVTRCAQFPQARLAWLTLLRTGRRRALRRSPPTSSTQTQKKSWAAASGAARSVSCSLSLTSDAGCAGGGQGGWRATSAPRRQPPPEYRPSGDSTSQSELDSHQTNPETDPRLANNVSANQNGKPDFLPDLSCDFSGPALQGFTAEHQEPEDVGKSSSSDTSWQYISASESADSLPEPPQTFNVLVNQGAGSGRVSGLRRSGSAGLEPVPPADRPRYRSQGDITFSRPGPFDDRELQLRRSHWDPLKYTGRADSGGGEGTEPPETTDGGGQQRPQAGSPADQLDTAEEDRGRREEAPSAGPDEAPVELAAQAGADSAADLALGRARAETLRSHSSLRQPGAEVTDRPGTDSADG